MDYGEVLSRAWQIVRRHKVLWIFGILAGCSSGGGSSNANLRFERPAPPEMQRYFDQFANLPEWQLFLIVAVIIVLILLLVILAIFLSTIGRIGLIRGTQQAEAGAERLAFGDLFRESLPYFWRVFGLNLLFGLAVFFLVLILILPLILLALPTFGLAALCILPLVCILVPLIWFASVVLEQANVAIVVDRLGIADGVQRAWEVVRANLGAILVMALILVLGVSLIGGFIIGLPLLLLVTPAVVGTVVGTTESVGGGLLIAALCFVAYLPVLLILTGILRSYIESSWTLTYLRLSRKAAVGEPTPAS